MVYGKQLQNRIIFLLSEILMLLPSMNHRKADFYHYQKVKEG